jgi:hypothetical protein
VPSGYGEPDAIVVDARRRPWLAELVPSRAPAGDAWAALLIAVRRST